ncbi:MAG: HEAT repeat domain-containing protein [Pyrinomonadaceae bacterium]|nr:HEAT repeat domain-containing protein [Pyrinomonadaceae bacterium]
MKTRRLKIVCLIAVIAFVALTSLTSRITLRVEAGGAKSFRKLIDKRERLMAQAAKKYLLPAPKTDNVYSLLISLPAPAALGNGGTLLVTLRSGPKIIASKSLHVGDPDLYTLFHLNGEAGEIEVISAASLPVEHTITILEWPESKTSQVIPEAEPNDSWRESNRFELSQTVWATADDKPYILPLNEATPAHGAVPYAQQPELTLDRLPDGGVDWFTFSYDGAQPKLVHFELDLLERDNIPVDVAIFTVENGETKTYERGADPVTPPHEVQALPGNKFTTRVITKGTYYVRVDANHVFYQLRTAMYDLPPYTDPPRAVRAGMDYLVSAGDSWHANTPRHGGIVNRVSSNHHETQTCIACHATHFTTRGELTAKQNGYAVNKRSSLQFLTERLANNPRPFYGHPEAYWTNVISASANVMSRLAALVNQFDQEFTGEHRLSLLKGVAGYLKIYYRGRTELPSDESNGNTPLVSTYEVAWYSWKVFAELSKLTGENEYSKYRDQLRKLIEQDKIKNNIDLCYQTIALIEIDRAAYVDKIKRNAERLLALQRPDGQWSMLFEPHSPAVEFQTYHCLYTLARAGYSPEHPQIAKALKFALARQQEFGAWFDPVQSYENFRTPFRETQFAVMALSEFYKDSKGKGWQAGLEPLPSKLAEGDALLRLQQIDNVWDQPSSQLTDDLITSLRSEEPMMRMAAAAALGRTKAKEAIKPLSRLLGDRSKLVQLAAAQALRRLASQSVAPPPGGITNPILTALKQPDERTRWGATRIFAQHFADLAGQNEIADKLLALLADPVITVRVQAAQALVRLFYWTKEEALQDRIADTFIARMSIQEHPWMRRNLREGFYNLADENVRYLYNNWIGHLAEQEDRDRATRAHREASRRMAERIARALETGNELQREGLLRGLTEFHLRSGGYANAGRYTRIGNDIETIVFYAEGAPAMERALAPLVNSSDATRRQQAMLASYTLRDNTLMNLPLQVMQRLNDTDPSVRAVANEFYRSLPLKVVEQNRREAMKVLKDLLASRYPEAQIAAFDRIKALGEDRKQFDAEVRSFVLNTESGADKKTAAAALRALADFPHLANDAAIQQRIASALQSADAELSRAATQLVLFAPALRGLPTVSAALDDLLKSQSAAKRKMILDLINTDKPVENDLRLISLLAESLEDPDESVRTAALNAVRRVKTLQANAAIRAGLAKLTKDPNQRLQGLAIAIYQGQGGGVTLDLRAEEILDYNFFVQRVMPLLARKGADGNACVNCHVTHTIFKLNEPNKEGRFTEAQLRENYRSALKVVDLINPENGLLLRKPTGDASQEGLIGAKTTPHGGGRRWQGAGDQAYQIVLEWINGAKVPAARGGQK